MWKKSRLYLWALIIFRLIFDQWPKLHLDLDSLSNQRILNVVYSLWLNGGNKANWRNIKAKLKKKYFVSFLLYFIIPSGFMSFLPAFVDKSRSSGSETWSSEDGSWSSGSGSQSSEFGSWSSGSEAWSSKVESWSFFVKFWPCVLYSRVVMMVRVHCKCFVC